MKMKFLFALSFFLLSAFKISSQKNEYLITGNIDTAYNNKYIKLHKEDQNVVKIDSCLVVNGRFTFAGSGSAQKFSKLILNNGAETIYDLNILLEEGIINVDLINKPSISGTPYNDLYQSYLLLCDSYNNLLSHIRNTDTGKLYVAEIFNTREYFVYLFQRNNLDNIVGRQIFHDRLYVVSAEGDDTYFNDLYNRLDPEIQKQKDVLQAKDYREKFYNRQQMTFHKFKDFVLYNPQKEQVKISDYVGKSRYLLIEFWASWCGPCLAEVPHLKDIYIKYKDKGFNILSISLDDNQENWLKALDKIDTPWGQASDLQGVSSELTKAYNVKGIPASFLLGEKGIIIKTNLWSTGLHNYLQKALEVNN